jgi:HK97 family phage major capsid protein
VIQVRGRCTPYPIQSLKVNPMTTSPEVLNAIAEGRQALDAHIGDRFKRLDVLEDAVRDIQQKGESFGGEVVTGRSNVLAKLSNNPQIASLRDRSVKTALVKLDASLPELLIKSAVTGDGSSSTGATPVPLRAQVFGEHARRRLSVLDVLPRLPVSAGSFEFERLDGYSAAAAFQANEGAPKAQTSVPMGLQTVPVTTIAHFIRASEQVLSDVPYLQQLLGDLLRYGVMRKLENEVIAGSTSGKIAGLQQQADEFTPAGSSGSLADQIGEALTELDIRGWNGGLVILHPNDWQSIRAERDDENGYVAAGWSTPNGPSIWGIPAVTSPAVTEGRPLVLDPSQCIVLDRQQATVELGRAGDDFTENMLTLRGELRAGLALFSPSAVLRITANGSQSNVSD